MNFKALNYDANFITHTRCYKLYFAAGGHGQMSLASVPLPVFVGQSIAYNVTSTYFIWPVLTDKL